MKAILSECRVGRALMMLCAVASVAIGQPTSAAKPTTTQSYEGSGISGPGSPWRPDAPVYSKRKRPASSAVENGLIPNIKPLPDLHVRDTILRVGHDGNYYLTGSTGDDIWKFNDGIELWKSPDLQNWEYLGVVWDTIKDGTWGKSPSRCTASP